LLKKRMLSLALVRELLSVGVILVLVTVLLPVQVLARGTVAVSVG
jgi:hypothetical protein